MASSVWEFAELGFEEAKSSAYESEVLEKNGFKISDRGIGGIDTSWIATWGSGSPVLGILVEFDALPGLGNDTVPTKTPAKSGNTNGHGCGHNLIFRLYGPEKSVLEQKWTLNYVEKVQ